MPLSKYDPSFGGKKNAAAKARRAMIQRYGMSKGERVFYAMVNKHRRKLRPKRHGRPR